MLIKLTDVRLSFPFIWSPDDYMGKLTYKADLVMDPTTESGTTNLSNLRTVIDKIVPPGAKPIVPCPSDGDPKYLPDGMKVVKARSSQRPALLDVNNQTLPEHTDSVDVRPRSGDYVTALVDLIWLPKFKRIYAKLQGVKYLRDGEPFIAGPTEAEVLSLLEGTE